MREQPSFPVHPATVAREAIVGADHTVAGNDERDGIRAVRQAYSAAGKWLANSRRDRLIRRRGADGNLP
jgi:hypothetical protein